jgi:PAS domain S-box-containing protein
MPPRYRILYVDDEPDLLEITKLYLEKDGQFSVDCALSGKEAIPLIMKRHYDAIVADYQMPEMNGIALLQKVRETDRTLPFILFTGRGREEVVIEAINSGVDFYLQKGGDPESQYAELMLKIRTAADWRHADTALKTSEEKYRLVLDATNDGIWDWNIPDSVTFFSPRWYTMLGYEPGEIPATYATWQSLLHPDDREQAEQKITDHIAQRNEHYSVEFRMRTKQGGWKWILARGKVVERDAEGNPIRMVGTHTDIDERKRAESDIQNSRTFLNSIIEQSPNPIWISDEAGTLVRLNNALCEMLQVTPDEVVGRYNVFSDTIVEEQGKMPLVRSVFETGKPVAFDLDYDTSRLKTLPLKRSTRVVLQVTMFPIRNDTGKITNIVVEHINITERRRAEEALRKTSALLNETQEISHLGGWEYDIATGNVIWTDEVYRIHGVERDFNPGDLNNDIQFYTPRDAPVVEQAFRRCIENGEPYDLELELIRADGRRIWVRTMGKPVTEDGRIVRVQGNIADITERRRVQDALHESERRYRNLYLYAQVGLFETSLKDGTVVACNERYALLAGFSSVDDAIGKDIVHLYANTEDRKEVIRILHEHGQINDHIVRFRNHQTGIPFWAQFSARINREKDVAEGTIVDITEQKRIEADLERKNQELAASYEQLAASEEELKAQFDALAASEQTLRISEERLLMAQDIASTGCWEYNLQTDKIWGSAQGLRIFGFPAVAGDFPISEIENCIPERGRVHQALVDLLAEGKEYDLEYAITPADGSAEKYIHSMARLEKDAHGNIVRVMGVIQDITGRRRIESDLAQKNQDLMASYEQLTASEEELKAQFDALSEIERTLRINEKRLLMSQEIGHSGSWEYSLETNQIWGSAEALRIYGFPPAPDHFPIEEIEEYAEDRERVRQAFVDFISGKGEYDIEITVNPRDGSPQRIVRSIARLEKDTKGNPLKAVGVLQDITEQKQAQAALRESERRFMLFMENLPAAAYLKDLEGRVIFTNRFLNELFGWSDTAGKSTFDLLSREVAQKMVEDDRNAALRGIVSTVETITDVHGRKRSFSTTKFAVPDSAGSTLMGGISLDITERMDAEQAWRESEQRFRAIFNASFQFTGLMKPDGTLIEANKSAMDYCGILPEQVYNKPFWKAHWWKGDEKRVRDLRAAITRAAAGEFVRYEVELQGAGDTRALFDFSIKPVFDQDGRVTLLIPEGRDITERKRAEDALVRVNRKLNILNDLTRKDLGSQIFILKSYLELARKAASGQDTTLRSLQKIENSIRSINEITEFTRDYQNMGESPPKWQNVKLAVLFGISHVSLGNIRHSIETENLEIFADPLLEKAFQGLIENTLEHGGKVSAIRVTCSEVSDSVTIVYEDNGSGIAPEIKEAIFLRGNQAHASVRGLFFVREILDLTGITIRECGVAGKGVRFEIRVPRGMYRRAAGK